MKTDKRQKHLKLAAALLAILASLPAFAADGDKSKIKGLIIGIQGDTVTIKDANDAKIAITLAPTTTYKMKKVWSVPGPSRSSEAC